MSHTDPIADMLTRVRNAVMVDKKDVNIPLSGIKLEIAKILKREGYVDNFKVESNIHPPQLVLSLKYRSKKPVIEGIERVSRPGRRVYRGFEEIESVLGGFGMSIVSTSKGLLTTEECKTQKVGGEVLLRIW